MLTNTISEVIHSEFRNQQKTDLLWQVSILDKSWLLLGCHFGRLSGTTIYAISHTTSRNWWQKLRQSRQNVEWQKNFTAKQRNVHDTWFIHLLRQGGELRYLNYWTFNLAMHHKHKALIWTCVYACCAHADSTAAAKGRLHIWQRGRCDTRWQLGHYLSLHLMGCRAASGLMPQGPVHLYQYRRQCSPIWARRPYAELAESMGKCLHACLMLNLQYHLSEMSYSLFLLLSL